MNDKRTLHAGFIGLGNMGFPMAKNLLTAGFSVCAFDLAKKAVDAIVAEGAERAVDAASVAEGADVVITMLQNGDQVKSVCLGEEGLFAQISKKDPEKPVLYLDCSSIEIAVTQALHALAEEAGIPMLDAPVSGGVAGAAAGTLTFMVGGDAAIFEMAKPVLGAMGRKIVHAGNAGMGQAAKICNNLILAISMIAVSEGFSLGKKLGLDPKKFFEMSANSSGQCWSMTSYCPEPHVLENVPSSNNYVPGFPAAMMLKDLRLAQHAAEMVQGLIPLGSVATELYAMFINEGHAATDFSGIIKMFA